MKSLVNNDDFHMFWNWRGDVLLVTVAGAMFASDLAEIPGRLAESLMVRHAKAVVIDARDVAPRLSAVEWSDFAATNTTGVPASIPVALVVADRFLEYGDAYSMAMAERGRLRCFFSEIDQAFGWAAWWLVRRAMFKGPSSRWRTFALESRRELR